MNILTLLIDSPMPSQRYAIDGAILIKSVEENVQKVEVLLVTVQNNKRGKFLHLLIKINKGISCLCLLVLCTDKVCEYVGHYS